MERRRLALCAARTLERAHGRDVAHPADRVVEHAREREALLHALRDAVLAEQHELARGPSVAATRAPLLRLGQDYTAAVRGVRSRPGNVSAAMRSLALLAGPILAFGEPLAGDWIGQIDLGRSWQRIYLHVGAEQQRLAGTLELPQLDRKLALRDVEQNDAYVHLEWQDGTALATFDGELGGDALSGEYGRDAVTGRMQLVRTISTRSDLELCSAYAGSYRLAPDRFIDLAPFSEDEDRPVFFDSLTRRTGVLYATSATEFFSGPSYGVLFPIDIRVAFVRNERGDVTGLRWQEGGAAPVNAERVAPFTRDELEFRNGDVVLRGTLTLPAGEGPHPVIVQVHGSGPERRPGGHWTHFFVRHGIGYLYFDKRGAGASTGDWMQATLGDLASDVLAGVAALRKHDRVDARHIGLWGNSNGGWVAPLAASRDPGVAFVIVRSGSGLPVHENILYELEMDMRGAGGFSEDEIARAKALRAELNAALLRNSGWDALRADVEKSRQEKWFPYARVQWLSSVGPPLDSATNPFLKGLRDQIDFDPAATWRQVKCPVLVLLGELDANVPSQASAAIIERGLEQGGNDDYAIRILPKANHGLLEGVTGYSVESPLLTRYVPGYMDGMVEWVLKRVSTRPR